MSARLRLRFRRREVDRRGDPAHAYDTKRIPRMTATTPETGLERHGIDPSGEVVRNPTTAQLYMHALRGGDGQLAEGGPLVVDTGRFTGR